MNKVFASNFHYSCQSRPKMLLTFVQGLVPQKHSKILTVIHRHPNEKFTLPCELQAGNLPTSSAAPRAVTCGSIDCINLFSGLHASRVLQAWLWPIPCLMQCLFSIHPLFGGVHRVDLPESLSCHVEFFNMLQLGENTFCRHSVANFRQLCACIAPFPIPESLTSW